MTAAGRGAAGPPALQEERLTLHGEALAVDVRRARTVARVRHGRLEALEHGYEQYRWVRMVSEGRVGSQGSRAATWDELTEGAREAAPRGPLAAGPLSDLGTEGQGLAGEASPPDPEPAALARAALQMDRALGAAHPELAGQMQVHWTRQWTRMVDGAGREREWQRTEGGAAASGRIVREGDFWTVGTQRWRSAALPDPAALVNHLETRLAWGARIVPLSAGTYPVLFLPPVAFSLLAPIVARMSAPAVVAKTSPWAESRGSAVLSPAFSLTSDAAVEDGPRSVPWDDEGTPAGRIPLIDRGVLHSWILDRLAAQQMGIAPEGMGFAAELGSPPTARPSNLVVTPGRMTWEALLTAFPRLLILEGWIGGRPVNPLRGEMAGTATGLYVVEDGAVLGRVKDAVVSVDAFEAWGDRLLALGGEPQWVGGGMMQVAPACLPPLLVADVPVARKS